MIMLFVFCLPGFSCLRDGIKWYIGVYIYINGWALNYRDAEVTRTGGIVKL